jgi:hypothetical protein
MTALTCVALIATAFAVRGELAENYQKEIRPLMTTKCYGCHNAAKMKGDLNLERFDDFDSIAGEPEIWQTVLEKVQGNEMPPKKADPLDSTQYATLTNFLGKLPKPEKANCDEIASDKTVRFYRGYVMSRRINRAEYLNTIRDLFGIKRDLQLENLLPSDGSGGEGFDTTGETLFTSSSHIEDYLAAAEQITELVLPDHPDLPDSELRLARKRILFRRPNWIAKPEAAARDVISAFARRAWRRPLEPGEVDELMSLFERAHKRGGNFDQSVRLALQGVLVSPYFLFLAEPEPTKGGIQRLASIPLASKLSYFLWSSMPDEELLKLAEQDKLSDTNVYRAQVRRMLKDPKIAALGERFALQWLNLDRLGTEVRPDAVKYPEFDAALAAAMKGEVTAFFNHLVSDDKSLLDLIDCRYTFVNQRLAELYGFKNVTGDKLRLVSTVDDTRGGIIGMAGIHTLTSFPTRTSPVLRGRWILDALLGDKIPPPPPDVPALNEEAAAKPGGLSLRKQLEVHRSKAECASCHDKMDPLGFGLENFDALGRWRNQLNGEPVDAKGTLPSGEFYEGPAGLKRVLMARKDQIIRHLARKMTGFAYGRELNKFDDCVIDQAMKSLEQNDWRATVLIETIAMSYPFQHRFYPKQN